MTNKTILEEWKSLYKFYIKETKPTNISCEVTGAFGDDVASLKFYPPVSFQELFPFLKHTIVESSLYFYSEWVFSNQILNMTPDELKANIALGVIPIYNSTWLK
jgi:hypothetical protein